MDLPILHISYRGNLQSVVFVADLFHAAYFQGSSSFLYLSGPHREAPGRVRRQREGEENKDKSFYCGFHGAERVRQG